MKKLGKLSLSELKTGMSQISEDEANGLKGGTVQINGSIWYSLLEYHDLALAGQWNSWNHVLGLKGTVGPYSAQTNDNQQLSPTEALQLYYGGLGVRYANDGSAVVVPGGSVSDIYSNYGSGGAGSSYVYGSGSYSYGSSEDRLEPSVFHMGLGSDNIGSFIVWDDLHNNTQTLMDRFNYARNQFVNSGAYTNAQLEGMTFEFDGLNLYAYENLSGSSKGAFIGEAKGEILPI